jgi:1,4-alpha-glucan branching enzyme
MAFAMRAAELEVLAAGALAGTAAARELLALQASDWPFMVSRGQAVPYARERFEGHSGALARALRAGPDSDPVGLRNLAIDANRSSLLAA